MANPKQNPSAADDKAVKKLTQDGGERHTDANPELRSAEVLEPTQEQEREELSKHSEFEQVTGVPEEQLDVRPVVDADPGDGKTFAERTSPNQPWDMYNDTRKEADEKAAQARQEELRKATDDSDKE